MKELDRFLKALSEGMRALAVGVEGLAAKVDEISKTQNASKKPASRKTTKKSPPKPRKQASKPSAKQSTATDAVLAIIKRSKKGVTVATLKQKTGFDDKKIHNIIYKLKKKDLVKSVAKGVYIKA